MLQKSVILLIGLFSLFFIFSSCEKEEQNNYSTNTSNSVIEKSTQKKGEEVYDYLYDNFNVEFNDEDPNELNIIFYGKDNFTLRPDGEGYILSGNEMIDNIGVLVEITSNNYCIIDFFNEDFTDILSEEEVVYMMGGDHSGDETWSDCFEREWAEFADDFVSTIEQITNPHMVATAISIHCARYDYN